MPRGQSPARSSGFTLVELLAAIAIIGVLALLLLPALNASREASRRTLCLNHLRQLALASHAYASAKGEFPPGHQQRLYATSPVHRGTSLFVFLLPFVEHQALGEQWNFNDPLVNAAGGAQAVTARRLPFLICPSDRIPLNPVETGGRFQALTSYGGNGGSRSYFPENAALDGLFSLTGPASEPRPNLLPVRLKDVTDGLSHTLLFGERNHHDPNYNSFVAAGWKDGLADWGWWAPAGGRKSVGHVLLGAYAPLNYTMPVDFAHRSEAVPPAANPAQFQAYNELRLSAFGSGHTAGACFAMSDAATRFVHERIEHAVVRAQATRAGRETTGEGE